MRAKKKIRAARIPFRVPEAHELPGRLPGVLRVLYLIFAEGHAASSGDTLVRAALAVEAIRLTRILRRLLPGEREVTGLLALLLLVDARRAARTDDAGGGRQRTRAPVPAPAPRRGQPSCGYAGSASNARSRFIARCWVTRTAPGEVPRIRATSSAL